MKKALLLFAALLVAGCGEKSPSEGSESASENPTPSNESAEPSADTAKTPPAEPPSEEPSDTPNSLSDANVERLLKEALKSSSEGSESASEKPTAPSEEVKPIEEKQQEVKPEEPVAETEKPELTLKERVVGKWDFGGVTLIFDKNGTAKAMRGGNLMGGGTWFIKDGKIHTVSDGPAKTVVIYVINEDGNLQHPSRGEAKRIKTEDN